MTGRGANLAVAARFAFRLVVVATLFILWPNRPQAADAAALLCLVFAIILAFVARSRGERLKANRPMRWHEAAAFLGLGLVIWIVGRGEHAWMIELKGNSRCEERRERYGTRTVEVLVGAAKRRAQARRDASKSWSRLG